MIHNIHWIYFLYCAIQQLYCISYINKFRNLAEHASTCKFAFSTGELWGPPACKSSAARHLMSEVSEIPLLSLTWSYKSHVWSPWNTPIITHRELYIPCLKSLKYPYYHSQGTRHPMFEVHEIPLLSLTGNNTFHVWSPWNTPIITHKELYIPCLKSLKYPYYHSQGARHPMSEVSEIPLLSLTRNYTSHVVSTWNTPIITHKCLLN